ncbi:classical arabinogalactan protein 7-like [Corvus hawaiiensis]|uniref:classical arabinogalactan protein 7-like n=1 Tax=Corvus hawaiiensis TaxID=134902 RepID=UPI002019D202|nr:classical arabinogalactan protein 7-like [Corvus hawaiiensis]
MSAASSVPAAAPAPSPGTAVPARCTTTHPSPAYKLPPAARHDPATGPPASCRPEVISCPYGSPAAAARLRGPRPHPSVSTAASHFSAAEYCSPTATGIHDRPIAPSLDRGRSPSPWFCSPAISRSARTICHTDCCHHSLPR